jgi:cytohesin
MNNPFGVASVQCFQTARMDENEINQAAEKGDIALIAQMLRADPAAVNARGNAGIRPLHPAAAFGHVALVEFLIARGAEINAGETNSGNRPLHYAVEKGHLEVIRALLDARADPNIQDSDFGFRPLHLAVMSGVSRAQREATIAQFGPPVQQYMSLATAEEMIATLVAGRADPNLTDQIHGQTPLHVAADEGDAEAAAALIAHGADVNAKDRKGRTPADYATANGNAALAAYLSTPGGAPGSLADPTKAE